jgi:hypothetical protein
MTLDPSRSPPIHPLILSLSSLAQLKLIRNEKASSSNHQSSGNWVNWQTYIYEQVKGKVEKEDEEGEDWPSVLRPQFFSLCFWICRRNINEVATGTDWHTVTRDWVAQNFNPAITFPKPNQIGYVWILILSYKMSLCSKNWSSLKKLWKFEKMAGVFNFSNITYFKLDQF